MSKSHNHPLALLAQERLGSQPLIEWVEAKHDELRSWQKVAAALHARTDVFVSRETVRRWVMADRQAA